MRMFWTTAICMSCKARIMFVIRLFISLIAFMRCWIAIIAV